VLLTGFERIDSDHYAIGSKEGRLAHLLLIEDGMLLGANRLGVIHGSLLASGNSGNAKIARPATAYIRKMSEPTDPS
jgi:hypothetical protein